MNYMIIFNFLIIIIGSYILNYLLLKYRLEIGKKFDIIDFPDLERKKHYSPTPLVASFSILLIFNLLILLQYRNEINIHLLIASNFAFLVGFIDDKKNLSYSIKFIIIFLFLLIFFSFSDIALIKFVYTETFNKVFYLSKVESIFFSSLCILLLINAFNLLDGINSLAVTVVFIWFVFIGLIFKGIFSSILISLLPILILKIYYIFKNFYFLGDSGSLFLGMITSITIIEASNASISLSKLISMETIFILFMLPGIDMMRLFIFRIINKKNPFKPDRNHFHHYLIERFSLLKSLIIYSSLILAPIVISIFTDKDYLIILLFLCIYSYLIYFFRNFKY